MRHVKLFIPVSIGKLKSILDDFEVLEATKNHDRFLIKYKGILFDFIHDKYFEVVEIKAIDTSNNLREIMDDMLEKIRREAPNKIEVIIE